MNQSVTWLDIEKNRILSDGAYAFAEALKVNRNVTCLKMAYNQYGKEDAKILLNAIEINGCLLYCRISWFFYEVNLCLERNISMRKLAQDSIICLLSLRQTKRILWIPKEMMLMIAQMIWQTRSDIDVWNKLN